VRDHGPSVEIRCNAERIAVHAPAARRHQIVTLSHHHDGIPTHSRERAKTLIHIVQTAPVVEHRPLAVYESLACGGPLDSDRELRTTLAALNLVAIDARLEGLLESAAKNEPSLLTSSRR